MTTHHANALSQCLAAHRSLIRAVRDPLDRLTRRTHLSAKLSVRLRSATVTLLCSTPASGMFVAGSPGARFHLAFGSSGSCLLAALPDAHVQRILQHAPQSVWNLQTPSEVWERIAECRACDFCVDPGQFHPNVHGLSAPLRDRGGTTVAALTLMGFAHDLNNSTIDKYAKALLQVARQITVPSVRL